MYEAEKQKALCLDFLKANCAGGVEALVGTKNQA